jgi:hypothetical protein
MKITVFIFILFALFASIIDGVACAGHEYYQVEKTVSFVAASGANNQINQINQFDYSPFDHCGVSSHFCAGKLAVIVDYNDVIIFSSILLNDNNFIYTYLKLNTFLPNSERPPAIF